VDWGVRKLSFTFVIVAVGILLASIAGEVCAGSFDYSCSNCVSPDCICASTTPPRGLDPSNTPQIILLTFDDPVYPASYERHQQILTNHWNPNGTPIQATFYIQTYGSDYRLIQKHYGSGHEIAVHTMTHTTGTNTDLATWRRETLGTRKALADLARIPLEEIRGFRAPNLKYCHNSFQVIAEAGMEYDSSLEEHVSGLSTNPSSMIWPYTLDNGLGQIAHDGTPPEHPFPGLFEVPMWSILDTQGFYIATMNIPGDYTNILGLLKLNFTNHYEGNRAPMGIFLHEHWLAEKSYRIDAINDFITWALAHSNVWFVSTHALVEYMKNPMDTTSVSAFPPFITTPRWIDPDNTEITCVYTTDQFKTCGVCPPAYPMPDTIFHNKEPVPGGTAWVEITEWYKTCYGGHFVISNNTDKTMIDWTGHFSINIGEVTSFWNGTGTVVGTEIRLFPHLSEKVLNPGETAYIGFWVDHSASRYGIENVTPTGYGLKPKQPTLGTIDLNDDQLTTRWNNTSPGYQLMFTTNRSLINWQSIANVYGRTSNTTALPPGSTSGYLKLKALP